MATPNLDDVRSVGVFAGLGLDALQECSQSALRRTLAANRQVFSQGEPRARFHALVSGWVRVSQTGADGGQALLRFVGPGEPFGSFGIFVDGCYPAEATAVLECAELSWSAVQFRALMDSHPAISTNLLRLAGRRIGELQDRLREMAGQTAEQRIAMALVRLAEQAGSAVHDVTEIPWPLSRKDVAEISATTIYTTSRIIAEWQRQGFVSTTKGRIRLTSPARMIATGKLSR